MFKSHFSYTSENQKNIKEINYNCETNMSFLSILSTQLLFQHITQSVLRQTKQYFSSIIPAVTFILEDEIPLNQNAF